MNHVIAAHPGPESMFVLDNLSTHKSKRDMWLKRHKNVRFHCTPTHTSWFNQIEIWFYDPGWQIARRRVLRERSRTHRSYRRFHRLIQPNSNTIRLDKK
jgi:hypothetical protein